jgi:hypothetical protein
MMSLSISFNERYKAAKGSDAVLSVTISTGVGTHYLDYDFNARILVARTGYGDGGLTITPFAQIDRESLEGFRGKLIELGGNPPPLPVSPKTGAPPPAPGGLNL